MEFAFRGIMNSTCPSRRGFLQWTGLACASAACARIRAQPHPAVDASALHTLSGSIPHRPLGATGAQVSILGMGGYHLGQAASADEATRMVAEALDAGVNFFDNAWEYGDGKCETYLGQALRGKRDKAFVMTKVCTHGRRREVAMNQLEESLRRLQTDHLDLWQIHECIYDNDKDLHFAHDGVVRALEDAKRTGKTRFVGFTGHKHPRIHRMMLSTGFPFDTVQMPLNVFDGTFRSFEREIIPIALKRSIGVIGMKSLGGDARPLLHGDISVEEALGYAMSIPGVAVTVSGMDSLEVLRRNLRFAAGFVPYSQQRMADLRVRCSALANDGHYELYKTTTHYDAAIGRAQHGYPSQEELPF
jgi:aryl-alcohol dehydrogenase-like predicted oxidoreductase